MQPNNIEPYYNHGLGCWVKSKSDVKNQLKKIEGETGTQLEELGNENPRSVLKNRKDWGGEIDRQSFEWAKYRNREGPEIAGESD